MRLGGVVLLLALGACGWLTPYRIDIQQGNVIEASQIAQLRKGLSREQVRFALGTPLVTDVFHDNRWDYVYYVDRRSRGDSERGQATLFFGKDGLLDRWTAAVAPSRAGERKNRVLEIFGSPEQAGAQAATSPANGG
jgi:outer membrane protein assembly factor BamE